MRRLHPFFVPAVVLTLAIEILMASTARSAEPAADLASERSSASGATALSERAPASTPIRVAALLPWAGDAVGLAGEPAVLVAGVRRSLHAPMPDGLIDLGNPHAPSLERLAEARPDLVVADAAIHARLAAPIGKLGARVLLLETASVEQTLDALAQLSRALGGAPALDARIEATRSRITALSGRTRASLVALFGAPGTFYVMTERAWLGDLARTLGFELALASGGDERFPGLVAVSDEVMATARPDLVLLVAHGDPRKIRAELERRTAGGGAWAGLAKARLGIHVLDPELFSANPGLGIVEAAETLVALSSDATTGRLR